MHLLNIVGVQIKWYNYKRFLCLFINKLPFKKKKWSQLNLVIIRPTEGGLPFEKCLYCLILSRGFKAREKIDLLLSVLLPSKCTH